MRYLPSTLIVSLWGLLSVNQCSAQASSAWRTWDTSDGFEESYTGGVALSPNGDVWVKHGAVGRMNQLSGYSAPQYPDPKATGQIISGPDGTLWLWTGNQLKRFRDSRWTSYSGDAVLGHSKLRDSNSSFSLSRLTVAPVDRNHVLLLLPDQVVEFDAASGKSRTVLVSRQTRLSQFTGIRAARNGSLFVSGRGGVGCLTGKPGETWNWAELPPPQSPYADFEEPFEWPGKGVLVTGITPESVTAALGFNGESWRELYRGDSRTLRVWPGTGDSVWVRDGDRVLEIAGGRKSVAERTGGLTGTPVAIVPEGPGRFWIGTSQGLSHHMPLLWQTPPEAPSIDDAVNAITEDRAGRIWFLSARHLVCLDHSTWTSFPLPKGEEPWTIFTDGLVLMDDDRLAIGTATSHLLLFDPIRQTFHVVKHPQDRRTHTFSGRGDGSLVVETYAPKSKTGGALEIFDRSGFRPYLKPRTPWGNAELRSLQIGREGDIWAGGTSFFGVYHGSELRLINEKEGFTDPGAYIIHLDSLGNVVAGGRDGLFQQQGQKWRRIQSGLDRIRSILRARDGTLWIASGTGVHRSREGAWISNGMEEGLPSSVAYKIFQDSRGRIWAGTASGLSLFHPEADIDPPQVLLAEDQNSRETSPGGQIHIVFSGVDKWKFTLPSRLLFSYRLDSGPWSAFAVVSSASFEKLSAGSHRFEVRAMDRNGNISPGPAIHQFSVLLPWYDTPGFRWTVGGSGALIVLLITLASISYSHRGWLIQELSRKGKLERDRQAVLQMIAGRETLHLILRRIAALTAANCPGTTCVVLRVDQSRLYSFCEPAMPGHVRAAIDQFAGEGAAPKVGSDEWWNGLYSIPSGIAGSITVVPASSGDRRLGAIALFGAKRRDLPTIRVWLGTFGDLAAAAIENAGLYEQLEHQARHDALTGLPNRHYFEKLLESSVAEAKAQGRRLAVLFLDLDRFKHVNDTLGHRVGDLFLKQVSTRLAGVLKTGETLARIGGDEFTVLVESVRSEPSTVQLAASLLAALQGPVRVEDHELFASASIGISFFPEDGDSPSTLQQHADSAMYRAKAGGRNQVKLFSPEMGSTAAAAFGLERLLHQALDEERFELHYQPQFTSTGQLAGMEALLRLQDAKGNYVSPARLIPIAEETGLIIPIGAWVLREGCRQLREWLDEGLMKTTIAINVSAVQLAQSSFAAEVGDVLSEFRIDPRLIQLELTESAIMKNVVESRRQMSKLQKLGVGIAVDDFGTGHSALAYLQALPINVLKIDRGFVHRVARPSGLPMIKAILALAANLGMTVVAEGVETESQLIALRDCGCDVLQGYFLCRPQPASAVRSFLCPRRVAYEIEEDVAVPVG